LRDLLDRLARERASKETGIDEKLPDSPEALTKAIQRQKRKWDRIVRVYKKNSKPVHDGGKPAV